MYQLSVNLVGAPIAGRLSDWLVVHYRKKRGGDWYAEDRLRATLPGALLLVPLSVLMCGILTQYVPGTLGLVLNLFCLFLNGLGVNLGFACPHPICVDEMYFFHLPRSTLSSLHLQPIS